MSPFSQAVTVSVIGKHHFEMSQNFYGGSQFGAFFLHFEKILKILNLTKIVDTV